MIFRLQQMPGLVYILAGFVLAALFAAVSVQIFHSFKIVILLEFVYIYLLMIIEVIS